MWWIAFYHDGTFCSRDGGPDEAPARGVQVVIQHCRRHGQEMITNRHWYAWDRGRWVGLETVDGLWDYLWRPGWKRVLSGRVIDRETYNRILAQASAYCRYGDKRAAAPWEPD
jgi:hypothetical protein